MVFWAGGTDLLGRGFLVIALFFPIFTSWDDGAKKLMHGLSVEGAYAIGCPLLLAVGGVKDIS